MGLEITPASDADYDIVHNLARFYIYDISEHAGLNFPADGLFDSDPICKLLGQARRQARVAFRLARISVSASGGWASGRICAGEASERYTPDIRHGRVLHCAAISPTGIWEQRREHLVRSLRWLLGGS